LWREYTPDVHGIQVLTTDHLDRAHTLDSWDVHALTENRYLVQAKDLELWYAEAVPDPDVLFAGSRDFGQMIITADIIEVSRRQAWP
jgi:hypothetical protein